MKFILLEACKFMRYISTRNNCEPVSAAAAIAQGMVPAGGLFVPEAIPTVPADEIAAMAGNPIRKLLSGF